MPFRKKKQDIFLATAAFVLHIQFLQYPILLLLLALQPAVGFGLSNNTSPFVPIYHQLSPSSHAQHLKISFHFFSPSFPGSSSSSCPFQFLSEDLFPIPNTVYKNIAQLESNSTPGTGRLSPPHHVQTRPELTMSRPGLELTQYPIQKVPLALIPTANSLQQQQSVNSLYKSCTEAFYILFKNSV